MPLLIKAVIEYNDEGYLIHSSNYIGAYVHGRTKDEALNKFDKEIKQYIMWSTGKKFCNKEKSEIQIVQEKKSNLQICDADSDVLFESEKFPLNIDEYKKLKLLVMKSANDFKALYDSIPDKHQTSLNPRKTFYGEIPRTANEMYTHANNVVSYYIREIGININNLPDISENRINALKSVEAMPVLLENQIFDGSCDEQWTLRKVLRRFIWHDRIHAKAMYRMAVDIWGIHQIKNPFFFEL